MKKIRPRVPGIPHLQLFGQLADLRNYRVRGVMAGKIILAEEAGTKKLVVFKTLLKAPAVYKKAKTSLLPINIAHMVKLLKYFETDDCVYLMLVSLNNNIYSQEQFRLSGTTQIFRNNTDFQEHRFLGSTQIFRNSADYQEQHRFSTVKDLHNHYVPRHLLGPFLDEKQKSVTYFAVYALISIRESEFAQIFKNKNLVYLGKSMYCSWMKRGILAFLNFMSPVYSH